MLAFAGIIAGSTPTARAAGGSTCGSQATSSLTAHSSAGEINPFNIAKWLGEKAAGAAAGQGFNMAFDFLNKVTGLDKILPESGQAKILRQLDEIKLQLAGISEQLEKVSENVGQLIAEERQHSLDAALAKVCPIANKNLTLFRQQYVPLVKAATELGQILEGPNPGLADVKGPSGFSPRERAAALSKDFIDAYKSNPIDLETGITEIHTALGPGSAMTSVLAAYGQVLMTKRFLTRADSEQMMGLYSDLAEAEALASWMAAEYRADARENPEALENVLNDYLHNRTAEQKNLPPMIQPGAVIDLGKVNSLTTVGKPIWFAPSDKDLGWLPSNSQYGVNAINEVGSKINDLNNSKSADGVRGSGWAVPTKFQLTALLSDGCTVDPDNPTKYVDICKNAVGPKTGTTVAGYLQRLDLGDKTWQRLFCQTGSLPVCPPESGPAGDVKTPKPPHAFIWTRETVEQKLKCGYTILPPDQSARFYTTYTGFRTLATGASQGSFPPLPEKVPGYGVQSNTIGHEYCDRYFSSLAFGKPDGTPRSPWVSGVLLATRNTSSEDLNADNGLDYMAQRAPRCAGQLATIVGTNGADNLRGTPGRDVIVARGGNDVVSALAGNDLICGGAGSDLLIGGPGADKLIGQRGNDSLRGGPGKDVLSGGRGRDTLRR